MMTKITMHDVENELASSIAELFNDIGEFEARVINNNIFIGRNITSSYMFYINICNDEVEISIATGVIHEKSVFNIYDEDLVLKLHNCISYYRKSFL